MNKTIGRIRSERDAVHRQLDRIADLAERYRESTDGYATRHLLNCIIDEALAARAPE